MQQYHYDLIKTLQDKLNGSSAARCVSMEIINHACREILRESPLVARVLDNQELNFGINPHSTCKP